MKGYVSPISFLTMTGVHQAKPAPPESPRYGTSSITGSDTAATPTACSVNLEPWRRQSRAVSTATETIKQP